MRPATVYASLGLSRNPFPPTPDAGSYFFTPRLEEDFTEIQHCIEARKGFVLLTGEVGLGKSTMVRRLLDALHKKNCQSALILNTFLQGGALLSAIQLDFGLPPSDSVEQGLARLTDFLVARHHAGKTSLLVIDDAQNLSVPSLELVRLLCNLETDQEKLLQILLVGQPELESTLARPELRQLKSRIVKHARLSGLKRNELARYFDFRINAANGEGRLSIDAAAADALHRATDGNLRQIHLVLDRCLYGLANTRNSVVTVELVRRALNELPTLGATAVARRPSRRKAWIAAGALVGTVGVAAMLAVAMNSGWIIPVHGRDAVVATHSPSHALTPQPSAVPIKDVRQSARVPTIPKAAGVETSSESVPTSLAAGETPLPTVPTQTVLRSECEKRLSAIATADEVLNVQPLPDGLVPNFEPGASSRICRFDADKQKWIAWLSRGEVRYIPAAQQATRTVQTKLKQMGLLDMRAPDDGLFGPKTKEAFARFQQQQGLVPTGKPDDLTFFLLEHLDAPVR